MDCEERNMVHIITDSAADLQPQEYEKLGVTCIPLRVANFEKSS